MIDAIPHPEDPSRLVAVEDLLGDLHRGNLSALALIQSQDDRIDALQAQQATLAIRVETLEELSLEVATLTRTVDGLSKDLATRTTEATQLRADLDALRAEVGSLRAQVEELSQPEPSGPAYGVDVSGHQTLEQVKAAAADPANEFVIVKATEGMTWKSPDYAGQVAAVRAAGKRCGAYHFAWCNQDPLKEAANFLAGAALKPGDIAALDLERETAGETWAVRVAYALAWLDEVKAKSGATPVVYVNWNWIKGMRTAATLAQWDRLTQYPLWIAEWTGTPGDHSTVTAKDGSNPDDWPILIHQYGVIVGLDRNWTPDIAKLRAVAVP